MFLPYRSKNPPESLPFGTLILIFFNVLFFALTTDGWSIKKTVLMDWGLKGSDFDFVHIMSSMFLHGDWIHLLGNMFFLYLLGFAVEGRLRTFKFLAIYFTAGFVGDALFHVLKGRFMPDMPSIGASGAIMGVMGAALWMFPYGKVTTVYWFWFWRGVFDCPMWGIALYFLGFDFLNALLTASSKGGGVNNLAHLGGALGGLLATMVFRPRRDTLEASDAKAMLHDTKDLGVLNSRELRELHKANPAEEETVLHWVHKSIRENRMDDECKAAFQKALPKLIAGRAPASTAQALLHVYAPGMCRPADLIALAQRLERENEPHIAVSLYERAYGDPHATPADHEACLFRVGLLCEGPLRNPARAMQCYEMILKSFPMGSFAAMASTRLKGMAVKG
ncbi:rhomboid family intramembrane serine protease [bacterium]|nr:MAG: rhomboid family intramembrane serine protease [bacterium]